jgi:hypothetical protein
MHYLDPPHQLGTIHAGQRIERRLEVVRCLGLLFDSRFRNRKIVGDTARFGSIPDRKQDEAHYDGRDKPCHQPPTASRPAHGRE